MAAPTFFQSANSRQLSSPVYMAINVSWQLLLSTVKSWPNLNLRNNSLVITAAGLNSWRFPNIFLAQWSFYLIQILYSILTVNKVTKLSKYFIFQQTQTMNLLVISLKLGLSNIIRTIWAQPSRQFLTQQRSLSKPWAISFSKRICGKLYWRLQWSPGRQKSQPFSHPTWP